MADPSTTPKETRDTYVRQTSAEDLLKTAIVPALTELGMDSPEARTLLLATAAHESGGFKHTRQISASTNLPCTGDNGAFGYFQMEVKNGSGAEALYNFIKDGRSEKIPDLQGKDLMGTLGKLCNPPANFAGKKYTDACGGAYGDLKVKDVIQKNLLENPVFGAAMAQVSYKSWDRTYPQVDANGNVNVAQVAKTWERCYNLRETTEEGQAAQQSLFANDFKKYGLNSAETRALIMKPASELLPLEVKLSPGLYDAYAKSDPELQKAIVQVAAKEAGVKYDPASPPSIKVSQSKELSGLNYTVAKAGEKTNAPKSLSFFQLNTIQTIAKAENPQWNNSMSGMLALAGIKGNSNPTPAPTLQKVQSAAQTKAPAVAANATAKAAQPQTAPAVAKAAPQLQQPSMIARAATAAKSAAKSVMSKAEALAKAGGNAFAWLTSKQQINNGNALAQNRTKTAAPQQNAAMVKKDQGRA